MQMTEQEPVQWTFFTNYTHVLICLHRQPEIRLREIAEKVGITERAVQRIVRELQLAGFVTIVREGRRNSYKVDGRRRLRHPLEGTCSIHDLLSMVGN